MTSPCSLMVIGLPLRSTALPAVTRIQPSLTQYSSTLVFSTPLNRDDFVLPWETAKSVAFPSPGFASNREIGEVREFQSRDFPGAADAYRMARAQSRQASEKCESQLILARVLVKAGSSQEALNS